MAYKPKMTMPINNNQGQRSYYQQPLIFVLTLGLTRNGLNLTDSINK